MAADTESKHWWRAEVSIAVNYLAQKVAREVVVTSASPP